MHDWGIAIISWIHCRRILTLANPIVGAIIQISGSNFLSCINLSSFFIIYIPLVFHLFLTKLSVILVALKFLLLDASFTIPQYDRLLLIASTYVDVLWFAYMYVMSLVWNLWEKNEVWNFLKIVWHLYSLKHTLLKRPFV